jgi:hypothetical protein
VYIGSGSDSYPLELFKKTIKTWVYFDSLPKSEGGGEITYLGDDDKPITPAMVWNSVKEWFLKAGFLEKNHIPEFSLKIFVNGTRKVLFFYNTSFPQNVNELHKKIFAKCSNIYLNGYDPNKLIIKYLKYPLNIIIGPNMQVNMDGRTKNELLYFLFRNYVGNINYYFVKGITNYEPDKFNSEIKKLEVIKFSNLLEGRYLSQIESQKEDAYEYNLDKKLFIKNGWSRAYNSGNDIPIDVLKNTT